MIMKTLGRLLVRGHGAVECHGLEAFPADALAVIDAQDLGLTALADDLCALRS